MCGTKSDNETSQQTEIRQERETQEAYKSYINQKLELEKQNILNELLSDYSKIKDHNNNPLNQAIYYSNFKAKKQEQLAQIVKSLYKNKETCEILSLIKSDLQSKNNSIVDAFNKHSSRQKNSNAENLTKDIDDISCDINIIIHEIEKIEKRKSDLIEICQSKPFYNEYLLLKKEFNGLKQQKKNLLEKIELVKNMSEQERWQLKSHSETN